MRRAFVVAALSGAACASSFAASENEPSRNQGDAGADAPTPPATDASFGADGDARSDAAGSTVTGNVVFVDAGDAAATSVILAPEGFDLEAFHESAPPGPRATGVTDAWTIHDVPPGTYLVLAGYERDGVVLDPSTPPPKVVVSGDAAETVTVPSAQRLVRALSIITIQSKSLEPAITFVDREGEDVYEVSVIDFQSKPIYGGTEPASSSNANVTFAIDAGLVVPLRYRFRVTAKKAGAAITQTEDLAAIRTAAPDDT